MTYRMRRAGKHSPFQSCHWVWQAGFLLVVAFLIHDGYMAVEGHVMAGMSGAHPAGITMGHEARPDHVALATGIDLLDDLDLVAMDSSDKPAGMPICSTLRPGVLFSRDDLRHIEPVHERPAFIPSEAVSSAWQSELASLRRILPPSRAPDAQRALFQVYLI